MNKINKNSIAVTTSIVSLVLGLVSPMSAFAATTPSLGTAATFGVLSSTYTNTAAGTTINGDLGYSVAGAPAVNPTVSGTTHAEDATWTQAGIDQGAALANLNGQACTPIGAIVALDSYDTDGAGPLPPGTFPPGCYSSTGAMNITLGTTVTLSGSGTYIFRPDGALTTGANSTVSLVGSSACNVFWTPTGATTLGATSTFKGTNIDNAGITVGSTVDWVGRALAFGGTVSTNADTITVPVCGDGGGGGGGGGASAPDQPFTIIKQVINDNNGTDTVSDFRFFVNENLLASGESIVLAPGNFQIYENRQSGYTVAFGGDCDPEGRVYHGNTVPTVCTIINDDVGVAAVPVVPPLIDVIKVPSPLALPGGPGPVTYTYTLKNTGTVPVTDVTMTGDTCSPIILISGDTDTDSQLDVNETWVYRCSITLSTTHTNVITASGWANGLNAIDVASATVVVGASRVPPLIHVTKIPSPLALFGAGNVTYSYAVTNPGTVAMSNVSIIDDRCNQIFFTSTGNGNNLLEPGEVWNFICRMNLARTTTNTVSVVGEANGFIARDFAIATVVVSAVGFPNTGFPPENIRAPLAVIVSMALILASIPLAAFIGKRSH